MTGASPDRLLIERDGERLLVALAGPPGAPAEALDVAAPSWEAFSEAQRAAAEDFLAGGAPERAYVAFVCARQAAERAGVEAGVAAAQAGLRGLEAPLDALVDGRRRSDEPRALARLMAEDPHGTWLARALAAREVPLRGSEWRRVATAWLGRGLGVSERRELAAARRREFRASAALAWRLLGMRTDSVPSWEAREAAEVFREAAAVYRAFADETAEQRARARAEVCDAWDGAYRAATREAHAAAEAWEQAEAGEAAADALEAWRQAIGRWHVLDEAADVEAELTAWLGRMRQLIAPDLAAFFGALGVEDADALIAAEAEAATVRSVAPAPAEPVVDPVARVRPEVPRPRIHGVVTARLRERVPADEGERA